jgi:hypothetical protein
VTTQRQSPAPLASAPVRSVGLVAWQAPVLIYASPSRGVFFLRRTQVRRKTMTNRPVYNCLFQISALGMVLAIASGSAPGSPGFGRKICGVRDSVLVSDGTSHAEQDHVRVASGAPDSDPAGPHQQRRERWLGADGLPMPGFSRTRRAPPTHALIPPRPRGTPADFPPPPLDRDRGRVSQLRTGILLL